MTDRVIPHTIPAIFDDALDMLTRCNVAHRQVLHAMRDAMSGQPGGHSFDVVGSSSVLWCWTHERDIRECQREEKECTGETIELHDPTGEAATSFDQARHDHRLLLRKVRHLWQLASELENLHIAYQNRLLILDRAGIGVCDGCRRYFDGSRGKRLTNYKGTGAMLCVTCRSKRDREALAG